MSTPRGPPMLGGEKPCCNWRVAARHRELMLWKCGISSFLIPIRKHYSISPKLAQGGAVLSRV